MSSYYLRLSSDSTGGKSANSSTTSLYKSLPTTDVAAPDPTTSALGATSRDRWNGAGGVALTVTGTGFHASAIAYVDGVAVTTAYNSATQLTATIPNTVYWEAGAKSITVRNPTGAESNAQVYTVTQPTYLHAELRPDMGRTMNGATVQVLADQSGKGDANRNVSNLTAAQQPTYVATDAAYNNQPTLTLDGGDHLVSGTWTSPPVQPTRVYYVGQNTGAFVTAAYLFDGIANGFRNALFRSAASTVAMFAGLQVNSSAWDSTTKAVVSVHYEATTSRLAVSAKTFAANVSLGTNNPTGVTIGASYLLGNKQTGTFAFYMMVDASTLTTAQHGEIMDYLGTRFGVTIGA